MKTPFTLLLCLLAAFFFTFPVHAQRMNAYGHFVETRTKPQALNRKTDPALDTLHLLGSSVFKTLNGYLTIEGQYENAPIQLRVYSPTGELRYQREYRQMVNMKFSPNKRYIAFHDMAEIQAFNTVCLTAKAVPGSNVFAVDDAFNIAYYDENQSSVHWKEQSLFISEPIYKILIRDGQPLFVGYRNVWKIGTLDLEPVFTAPQGRIFDAMVDSLQLHISTKLEEPCKFTFTEYTSQDLQQFQAQPSVDLPRAHCYQTASSTPSSNKTTTSEAIRNPLHYYATSIAQPVGNSYNEIQEYTTGDPYPHPGVDLLGNPNDTVYSVKNGVVKAILTTSAEFHWRVAIANDNIPTRSQGYLYAHVNELTIPYAVGDVVTEGDPVGFLVDWPVAGFTHCHFARISDQGATWAGSWWTLDNPLKSITNITDNLPPTFEYTLGNDKFAFRNHAGAYLTPTALMGDVRVISKFHDNINTLAWNVDVDQIRYSLSPLANPTQMLIDTLAHEYDHWNDNYFAGPYYLQIINTLYSRDVACYSVGNYDYRDFYHIVTNSDGNDTITPADMQQFFHTADFANGDYIFRVTAIDPFGLTATDTMIITIANPATATPDLANALDVKVFPNPSVGGMFHLATNKALRYEVWDAVGRQLALGQVPAGGGEIDLGNLPQGGYWLRLWDRQDQVVKRVVVE